MKRLTIFLISKTGKDITIKLSGPPGLVFVLRNLHCDHDPDLTVCGRWAFLARRLKLWFGRGRRDG
jgi:hypothetical protein